MKTRRIWVILLLAILVWTATAFAESWFCPVCGESNTGNFCTSCGTKKENVTNVCASCGAQFPEGKTYAFCPECGAKQPTVKTVKNVNLSESLLNGHVGDYVTFGHYEQNAYLRDGKEEIEWLVLKEDGNKKLLISKYGLDCVPYNNQWEDVTWATCTVRTWLNTTFLKEAFTDEEIELIPEVTIHTNENYATGVKGGPDTVDRVFFLSEEEATMYFSSDNERRLKPTEYAIGQKCYVHKETGGCWWCLRTPGKSQKMTDIVMSSGLIRPEDNIAYRDQPAVRPALWVDLTNAVSTAAPNDSVYKPLVTAPSISEYFMEGYTLRAGASNYRKNNSPSAEPSSMLDGNLRTSWDSENDLTPYFWLDTINGEKYEIHGFRIVNGKTQESYFEKNSRIKTILVYADGCYEGEYRLDDLCDRWQTVYLNLPAVGSHFEFAVVSTYRGSVYKDVCVAEIELF